VAAENRRWTEEKLLVRAPIRPDECRRIPFVSLITTWVIVFSPDWRLRRILGAQLREVQASGGSHEAQPIVGEAELRIARRLSRPPQNRLPGLSVTGDTD
jgi:hypothetical protein